MKGSMCRLYDEQLVRHIMVSTGLSIYEFIKGHERITAEEIVDYIELHAESIIEHTIEDINQQGGGEEDDPLSDFAGDEL